MKKWIYQLGNRVIDRCILGASWTCWKRWESWGPGRRGNGVVGPGISVLEGVFLFLGVGSFASPRIVYSGQPI